MENNELAKTEASSLTKFRNLVSQDVIKKKFEEALGKKAPMFVSNLTTIMSGSAELQKCDHMSVISSALMAASMDLPLTPGLGFAGIVPYFDGPSQQMKAQFQVMKKGFIQLAQRTGLFKIINVSEVFEGELKSHNKFTGEYIFDEAGKKSDNIIGYVSYFRLINGFEKYYYMPMEKLDTHAKRYSKSFQRGKGKWADKEEGGYEQMCEKTVLKLNLSTYAPLSVDINMMNAIVYDQAEIRDVDAKDYDYVDNEDSKQPEQKDVIDLGNGKSVVVNKAHEQKSAQMSSRATDKIKSSNFAPVNQGVHIQYAVVVNENVAPTPTPTPQTVTPQTNPETPRPTADKEESPFIPGRGSVEYMDGKEVNRTEGAPKEGALTIPQMMDMSTDKLLEIINADMETIEAMEMIPGKNTNKKLREIVFAHQQGTLDAHIEKEMTKIEAPPVQTPPPAEVINQGGIPLNTMFDKQGTAQSTITKGADVLQPDPPKVQAQAGNKYNILVPEYDKGQQREFSTVKTLFNKLMGIEPQITTPRYMMLAEKLGILEKFKDKELFCRDASVSEINNLLNAN